MGTVVAVPGGFVGGWYWDPVADVLADRGHTLVGIDPPSLSPDPAALVDPEADVAHLRSVLDAQAGPVVLAAHSAGGSAITAVADHAAIAHSVYVAALWPHDGAAPMDMMAEAEVASDWIVMGEDGLARATDDVDLVRRRLFAELDRDAAVEAHHRFEPQAMVSLAAPCSAPPRDHPTTYVICQRDQVVPPAAQEAIAERADHVERLDCSHAATLTAPDELAAILERILVDVDG